MTYSGRRTGRAVSHPAVFYKWRQDEVIVFSSSRWWLNMLDGSELEVLIDGGRWRADPTVIRDRKTIVEMVPGFIARTGLWTARLYRMGLPWLRRPTQADIANVGRGFVFVLFKLREMPLP